MAAVGFVTGLGAESRCLLHHAGVDPGRLRCAGADPARATAAAEALLAGGCGAIVSFGVAGGLSPDCPAGTLVLADVIMGAADRRFETDRVWRDAVSEALSGTIPVHIAPLAGSDRPVASVAEKQALFRRTGASAVDMESDAVARVAAAHACPIIVIRAIADPAERAVPGWLEDSVDADGRPRKLTILSQLLRRPSDCAALVHLAFDYRKALRTLRCVALSAGPILRRLDG